MSKYEQKSGVIIGIVTSVEDDANGFRIRAKVDPDDNYKEEVPYAFPLLPKMFCSIPKVGEAVQLLYLNGDPDAQRFYVGPIISQVQYMYNEDGTLSATSLFNGGQKDRLASTDYIPRAIGAYADKDEIAVYGRKDSDIILGDDDIRIRCGARVRSDNPHLVSFNKKTPSYIKLNYFPTAFNVRKKYINETHEVQSTATIVADEINLISNNGADPIVNTSNADDKMISDDDMKKIIAEAHLLPFGDKLVEFLELFVEAFNKHNHRYHLKTPTPNASYNRLTEATNTLKQDILSKNVRIN